MLDSKPATFDGYFLSALLALLEEVRLKDGHESQAIIMFEPATADLANALTVALFALHISVYCFAFNAAAGLIVPFKLADLRTNRNDIAVVMIEDMELYLGFIAADPQFAAVQTVLITSEIERSLQELNAGLRFRPRLLFVAPTVEPLLRLNLYAWSIDIDSMALPLTPAELFASHANPAVALFWNDVRRLASPLEIVAGLLPFMHVRQCRDDGECFAFGLHVLLANLLAAHLHTVPRIDFIRTLVTEHFATTAYRSDFSQYANMRDGLFAFSAHDNVTPVDANEALRVTTEMGDVDVFDRVESALIVPYRRRASACGTELQMLEKRLVIFVVWLLIVGVVSGLRYADRERGEFAAIVLNTWAQSTGNSVRPLFAWTLSQCICLCILAVFIILGGAYFSGDMYQNMFSCAPATQIESLNDLNETSLHLFIASESFPDGTRTCV